MERLPSAQSFASTGVFCLAYARGAGGVHVRAWCTPRRTGIHLNPVRMMIADKRKGARMKTIAMFSSSVLALTLATGLNAANSRDDAAAGGVNWACNQEHDAYFHVSCVPQRTRADTATAPADTLRERDAAPVAHGHDMRPVTLRGEAEVFSTRAWRIPLYSQPASAASAAGLLETVLCGGAADCRVDYADDGRTSASPRAQ